MWKFAREIGNKINRAVLLKRQSWLTRVAGVIHVGANTGQERELYEQYGLHVVWIEPIPEVFLQLRKNIGEYENQTAYQALITDKDNGTYDFYVANNDGASSSILELGLHRDVWPSVEYEDRLSLRSMTLDTLLQDKGLSGDIYDALVMDTQGSELLVLKGATRFLERCEYVQTEAADFDAYKGCCKVNDITAYLESKGFRLLKSWPFAKHANGGQYFDLLYKNK